MPCFTPKRIPVDELLKEQSATASVLADRALTEPALIIPTEPCPVCPFLTKKLEAAHEAAYWRVQHQRAVVREAKLKQQVADLEAKLHCANNNFSAAKPKPHRPLRRRKPQRRRLPSRQYGGAAVSKLASRGTAAAITATCLPRSKRAACSAMLAAVRSANFPSRLWVVRKTPRLWRSKCAPIGGSSAGAVIAPRASVALFLAC